MLDGPTVVRAIEVAGFTHVVWVPDSHLGTWDADLTASDRLTLVRATREGEAVGIAAGLILGGARPLVAVQCTGFFEAGDAVRNVVHDLELPLKLLVGVRSWRAHQVGRTADNCPRFAEPLVRAWELPATWFDPVAANATGCSLALQELAAATAAAVLLWAE
jgi:sulfopyruvate decarboxylase TPP-binding subunit